MDEQASSQGRWQEQAKEALDECGYAYFLPTDDDNTPEVRHHANHDGGIAIHHNEGPQEPGSDPLCDVPLDVDARNSPDCENIGTPFFSATRSGVGKPRHRRPATSEAAAAARLRSRRKASVDRDELEQSHGLCSELKRAIRVARATLKEGDRVESRWRRPTRLEKPRVDPNAWHAGRLVAVHKDGTVDVVFEDGGEERLSGTPAKHVRLAPQVERLHPAPAPNGPKAVCKRIDPAPPVNLCSASRRKLAHIAVATTSLRCTWEDPIPFSQELTRLRKLKGEKTRCRPEWRGSFPAVDFRTTKNVSFACGKVDTPASQNRGKTRQRIHREQCTARRGRRQPKTSGIAIDGVLTELAMRMTQEETRNVLGERDGTGNSARGGLAPCYLALVEAQSNLVAAAMAYDKCVAEVRQCLERGAAAFLVARTYSEQQSAFEETTATLGPAQPARAGYADWRGSSIVGLQSATLDVVEAMDAWATEWTAAKNDATGGGGGGVDREKNSPQDNAEESPVCADKAPPFLWEGVPLVSTIIGHSVSIVAGASELLQWYGPGFPSGRNPFFLAYPIDDRPVTPRDVLVRAYVNGEVCTGIVAFTLICFTEFASAGYS